MKISLNNACHSLPQINPAYIAKQDYFLLFETRRFDDENFISFIFASPLDIIKITDYKDVRQAFDLIQRYSRKYYLAGYFSYELGYYFEPLAFLQKNPLSPLRGGEEILWEGQKYGGAQNDITLIHLAVFDKVISFNHRNGCFNGACPDGLFGASAAGAAYTVKNLRLNFTEGEYAARISRIREYLKNGDTYQVNFTGRYFFDFEGSAYSLYKDLAERQGTSYAAFCKFGDEYALSLSPELFFKREGRLIYSRPMKGTAKRGRDKKEDSRIAGGLKNSAKNRAENLMIVDLIRNDLGRISETKSVKVESLFDIEKYNGLFQMTSKVKGALRANVTYFDIFKAMFPGGSVTGAPKIRTMRIIKELESSPRGIYCGGLGIIFPKNRAVFNMPIRTVSLVGNKAQMGIGSGIVYDSDTKSEYKECLLKAEFLTGRQKTDFRLLETILWDNGYKFLNQHLERMKNSARYFGFSFNQTAAAIRLRAKEQEFIKGSRYKARVLLSKNGEVKVEGEVMEGRKLQRKLAAVSNHRTDPGNIFYYHKTTNRALYDREYSRFKKQGYFDVLFLNKKGEVTEGAVSNIIIQKGARLYTPPVSCGLLPGIFRGDLLKNRRVKEKTLYPKDLQQADKIFLCNSVRGMNEVTLK